MKRNSVSLIEQHVEKIFFIVFLLALVGVISLQFLGGGSTVNVGNQDLPLGRAYEELGELAGTQLDNMESPAADSRVPQDITDLSSQVLASLQSPPSGTGDWEPTTLGFASGTQRSSARFVAQEHSVSDFQIPSPQVVGVAQHAGTLDPLIVTAYRDDLRDIIPNEQPYDVRSVSVGFTIDREVLYQALANANVPDSWYKRMVVLDVEVERRLVGSDEQTIVAPMPGRFSIREQLSPTLDLVQAQRLETLANGELQAEQLMHPNMYRFVAGVPWMPPTLDQESTDLNRIQKLLQQLQGIEKRIEELNEQVQQISLTERLRGIYAQVGGRGGGGRGGGREESADQLREQSRDESRERINARVTQLNTQATTIRSQLTNLGVDMSDGNLEIAMPEYDPGPARLSATSVEGPIIGWANDIAVESGQRYQYRVRYKCTNPLFVNEAYLDDSSRSLAQTPYLTSEWSQWSGAIELDRDEYWFATRTSGLEGGNLGFTVEPACTIDVYRFFYGYWRKASVRLHSGDSVSAELDVTSLELPLFDIDNPQGGDQLIDRTMAVDTGSLLLDIRAMPGGDASETSIIVRDALGAITSYSIGSRSGSSLRSRIDESFLSSGVASIQQPLGDVEAAFTESQSESQSEDPEAASDPASSQPTRSGPARDGRR
jgi:hypothetical protein